MTVSVKDIIFAEAENDRIKSFLDSMGRELYAIRNTTLLGAEYGFERYDRMKFKGNHYAGQEGPQWEIDEPIFSLSYYWPRACDVVHITFPESYLSEDWRRIEFDRVDFEFKKEKENERLLKDERASKKEISDREMYEKLKAKFEKE